MTSHYNDFRIRMTAPSQATVSTAQGRGAVASVSKPASELAIAVLNDGGNAFDAAFSLAFSLCVHHPQAGNLGGGGYLVFKEKSAPHPGAFNFREQAPARATAASFLLDDGSADPEKTSYGPTAVCVPGTVKAFFELQQRYGRLNPRDILLTIAKQAEEGTAVTQYEADCLNRLGPKLANSPEANRIYVRTVPYHAGDILRNAPLARTLERLAKEGEHDFYRGETAERIVTDLANHGGFVSSEDLSRYELREATPIHAQLCGKHVWTVPPEAGGALLIEILRILDRPELQNISPYTPSFYHYVAQASKLAFIDRLDYLGDVPLDKNQTYQRLFHPHYAKSLFNLIDPNRDRPSDELMQAAKGIRAAYLGDQKPIGNDTTHFAVIDAEGNAVSSSYTMNLRYGSKWAAEGTGVLLNGSMDAFSFAEGKENYFGIVGSSANAFAPGKRPASNMAPVLVTDAARVEAVLGTPGGPTIPTTLALVLLSTLVHRVSPAEAVQATRLHHQAWPDALYREVGAIDASLLDALGRMGYAIKDKNELIADVHAVFASPEHCLAVSDYRREGHACATPEATRPPILGT